MTSVEYSAKLALRCAGKAAAVWSILRKEVRPNAYDIYVHMPLPWLYSDVSGQGKRKPPPGTVTVS